MKEFKYDVILLINSVRERPGLWDKSLEVYKDRFERRKAWEEIFCLLDDGYESMSGEEKRLTGEHVLNKWTNIRDTFVKSLRLKMGRPRRKYILYDHLDFLLKTVTQDESTQLAEEVTYLKEERGISDEEVVPRKRSKRLDKSNDLYVPSTSKNDSISQNKRRSKKKDSQDTASSKTKENSVSGNDIDFIEINEAATISDHRLMNEDEAFFASLLPTVVKYSEDERLEFRIEVLGIMKRLKENRKWCAIEEA